MKRSAKQRALISVLVFSAALSACSAPFFPSSAETPAPTSYVSPAPSPAPTPAPVITVFGVGSASSFASGISAAAGQGGPTIRFNPGEVSALASSPPKGAVAIVCLENPEPLPKTNLPCYVFSAAGVPLPSGTAGLSYLADGAAQAALDQAVSYPPHLTPVRMIGLFTSAESEAYAVWSGAVAKGQVFAKREYLADASEEPLDDWMAEILSRYFPGMLDAVYAENGALAVAAAERLASLGRDDIEVFSAGTDAEALRALSPILVCAVGVDWEAAGKRCYEEAIKLLSGQEAQSDALSPEIFWYSPNP
ncbi:MAG: hypothetical protein VB062_03575 [Christensenella sp.]|nr:hypothetical protein [Christensenella sp.]